MHRAVESFRVARRTGALAASARREARARNSAARRAGVLKNDDRRPATGKRHAATAAEKRTFHGDLDSHRGLASRRHTPRDAAQRGGWVRRVRRVLAGGVRGRARSRNCAVGGRRGRCPFAAATATQVQQRRAARARRAPLAGLWCGELQMLQQVPRCPPTELLSCHRIMDVSASSYPEMTAKRRADQLISGTDSTLQRRRLRRRE
jgi:hypothetical protein